MSTEETFEITYTEHTAEGDVTRTYRRPVSEMWDVIARADDKFCRAATPQEERRYREIVRRVNEAMK